MVIIKLIVVPYKPYRKAIIKEGMKSGNLSINFDEDILSMLNPYIRDKITLSKKIFWGVVIV